MPFTVSHAVIAHPISYLTAYRLPIAGLVIGSMAPDLYRLFTQEQSNLTHLWSSIFGITLWLGLGFSLLWYGLYRPVVYRCMGIQDPVVLNTWKSAIKFIVLLIIALMIGIATHLIWDGLTHADFRTFAFQEFLASTVQLFGQHYPMHRLLQLGSSALVLPLIAWSCLSYYRKFQQHLQVSRSIRYFRRGLVIVPFVAGLCAVLDYLRHLSSDLIRSDLYYFTGRMINEFSQTALIVFSLGCVLFLFLDRNHRLG